MKYTENIGLPIVEDNDLYSKEINNLAFEEIDKNIEALAERLDLIDDPETGLGNLLEVLDKKTEEIETLIEDTDNATRLDLTNEILFNKITDVGLNDNDELIVTYGDGTELNVGVVGTGGAGTSSENKIEVDSNTDEEYVLKITTDGTDFLTPNLKGVGDNIFVGIDVDGETGDIIVDVAGSHIGDIYINTNNGNLYVRDDANNNNNHWTYKGNIRGIQGKSNYDLAVKNGFRGTEQDYLDSLVADNIEALIVANKPVLADPSTKLKTWYFYQVDGDTDNSAWKYKMVLPSVADYPAGDYCVYYDLKPYCGTFTANSPALTNKDKYKYYVIMDLQAVTTEVIREDLKTGNTVVLEKIQCIQKEPTTHTVIKAPMESLGKWVQTLYIGATKELASEVTLSTGTSVSGFVTSKTFVETVGNRSNLKTLDKTSIVNAINEHEELLRENTTASLNTNSKNVIGAINELKAKNHLDVFDLVGGNVLDYALTAKALTYTCFYANNCDGLPNNERYGYCYVEVSQDPLYRDLIFDSPTTGRRWSITIGSAPDNPAIQGEWSEWHEELLREDIANVLDNTVTNKQVASAKAVVDKLSLKANDSEVVKKADIVDNLTSTNTYKPLSASQGKVLNDTKLNKTDVNKMNCVSLDNVSLKEYILTNFTEREKTYYLIAKTTCTDLPKASNFFITVETPGMYTYKVTAKELNDSNGIYVSTYRTISSSWTAWQKVCTTTVADVPVTNIETFNHSTYYVPSSATSCNYCVRNGVCFANLSVNVVKSASSWTKPLCQMPKAAINFYANVLAHNPKTDTIPAPMGIQVKSDGSLQIFAGVDGKVYNASFSYPVAEE